MRNMTKSILKTIPSSREAFVDEDEESNNPGNNNLLANPEEDSLSDYRDEPTFAHEDDPKNLNNNQSGNTTVNNDNGTDNGSTAGSAALLLDSSSSSDDDLDTSNKDSNPRSSSLDDHDVPPQIAAKEARAVRASKYLVAFVLVFSAAMLGYFSYAYTRNEEVNEFHSKFHDYSAEIIRSSTNNAGNSFSVLETFSRTITSLALFANHSFPFITLPDFEVRAHDFQSVSSAEEVAFAPIVQDKDRETWEEYTVQNQHWIQQGLDYEYMVSLMDRMIKKENNQQNQDAATIAPGTNMEGFSVLNQAKPIQPFIWKHAPFTHKAIPEQDKGPLVPIWQTYPAPRNSYVVNHNLKSTPEFSQLIQFSIANRTTVLSDIVDNFKLFGTAQTISMDPKSVVLQPICSELHDDASAIVGFLIVIKKWEIYFQNVLYNGAEPVFVVLRNTCGKAFTYQLIGPQTIFLGEGDLHDPKYSQMVVVSDFSHPNVLPECNFTISIYPTQEMEDAYLTNMPFYVTLVVCVVFCFTTGVFILYDFFVSKRQQKTMASANATNRIVSNLFPKAVRDRLIQDMAATDADNMSVMSGGSGHFRNPAASSGNSRGSRRASTAFLNISLHGSTHGGKTSGGKPGGSSHGAKAFGGGGGFGTGTSEDIFGSKPIAELFPATTIMFADMVGFTAWSSIREPTHVFLLLETVYHAFDTIAKRRRVFKVETIGDCYVAVAGLPMPRKDHAVVMARFASECLSKMDVQVKNLEATLGPDTGDLSIRVGLHSGPVTAGVLRGEKGRFQLFGDTMNTASRMESTGMRGRIQVSRETAALLKNSGKESWVSEREEKVHAKGKGELQTYWLQIKGGSDNDAASAIASAVDPLEGDSGHMPLDGRECAPPPRLSRDASAMRLFGADEGPSSAMIQDMAATAKKRRLVEWNTEILGKLLKQIVVRRAARRIKKKQLGLLSTVTKEPVIDISFDQVPPLGDAIEEVKDIISLPHFDPKAFAKSVHPDSVNMPEVVLIQLNAFISRIADLYQGNAFHNFEHASHVTMSVTKLMSRIVNPLQVEAPARETDKILHDHTFGITSDPLTQFTSVLSALIHDADHPGVSNSVLVKEADPLAIKYKDKSVAEQNSVDLAWGILMSPEYKELRETIYTNEDEFRRFRQILVNVVLATDIMDKELGAQRKARWDKAFSATSVSNKSLSRSEHDTSSSHHGISEDDEQYDVNRKATIVLEHLIQASDVAHTMQHWHVYRKWNERLFCEVYASYKAGRIETDPSVGWYKGEIGFFDFYIIPLAKKLETCGVFGVSSMEYLGYAEANRREWEEKGEDIVQGYLAKFAKEETTSPTLT